MGDSNFLRWVLISFGNPCLSVCIRGSLLRTCGLDDHDLVPKPADPGDLNVDEIRLA